MTLALPPQQFDSLAEAPLKAWAAQMVRRLLERDPQAGQPVAGLALPERCVAMAREARTLGIDDHTSLLRLGEIVHALRPDMALAGLPAPLLDVLQDQRFSAEDRLDIVTLRLAFPVPE